MAAAFELGLTATFSRFLLRHFEELRFAGIRGDKDAREVRRDGAPTVSPERSLLSADCAARL
jgi:hypothetical protein